MHYYLNAKQQPSGEHEVHRRDCRYLPSERNRIYLGNFPSCVPAVQLARRRVPVVDGCYWCSRPCHRR